MPTLPCRLALTAAIAAVAALPSAASAATPVRFETIAGVRSAGTPAKYDKVGVLEVGRRDAPNILVLNPGTSASAAYFQPLGKTVVARAPSWQVWAVERRENLLEDHSMLDRGKARRATARQAFDYYLGWLADHSITRHFQMIPDAEVAYAKRWGMNVEIGDLRRVVTLAKRRGRKVVVGGHSLGGTITTAYATWDFHGQAGARGLSGLVLIDGASREKPVSAARARQSLADLDKGSPWLAFGGIPAPLAGLFSTTGALGVKVDPDAPSVG